MNPQEIGIVYNELRTKRVLFGSAIPGRRRSDSEIAAVGILRRCAGRFGDIEEFLGTQGMKMVILDVMALGIPGSGEVYVAVRNPLVTPPEHVCGGQIIQALTDGRRDESSEQISIWSVFLTLLLLNMLYTQERRPIEAVSAFKDSIVDIEEFLDAARQRIETLRSASPPTDTRQATIIDTLTALTERQLEGRIRSYFKAMADLGVLEKIENISVKVDGRSEAAYRQTLWSAVDLAENFKRYAPHLLIEDMSEAVDTVGSEQKAIDATDMPEDLGDDASIELDEYGDDDAEDKEI